MCSKNTITKSIFLTLVMVFSASIVSAQKNVITDEATIDFADKGKQGVLKLYWSNGTVSVKSHDQQNVKVVLVPGDRFRDRDSSRRDWSGGLSTLRKSDQVEYTVRGNEIRIDSYSRPRYVRSYFGGGVSNSYDESKAMNVEIFVPKNIELIIDNDNHGDAIVADVDGPLEIDIKYGEIFLERVGAPSRINSTYGGIEANISSIASDRRIYFGSKYGFVDITLPADINATLDVISSQEIYSGFDFDLTARITKGRSKNLKRMSKYAINGGGPEIDLDSKYGSIYIRKAK